jgi:dCTP deaminase
VCAQYALKSSLARAGFEHLLAGWIDPGFSNSVLTLELKNARKYQPIPLWPGMRIGQIIFMQMDETPQVSYKQSGRYNGDRKVAMCKGLM